MQSAFGGARMLDGVDVGRSAKLTRPQITATTFGAFDGYFFRVEEETTCLAKKNGSNGSTVTAYDVACAVALHPRRTASRRSPRTRHSARRSQR